MSNLNMHGVQDYETASAFLGDAQSKTLCFATTLHRGGTAGDPLIEVYHHNTAIIRYYASGEIVIRNAGYLTATTTTRLHGMTPREVCVSRAKGGSVTSPLYCGEQPYEWERVA